MTIHDRYDNDILKQLTRIANALEKIDVKGVKTTVIRSGTGTITESDVVLANASSAIIIGFNVRPSSKT